MTYRVVFQSPEQILPHALFGDWSVPDINAEHACLPLVRLRRMMPRPTPEQINFDQICAKPGDFHGGNDFQGARYDAADVRYPGLLARGMPNPCDLPYRMLDGRRRLHKLQSAGENSGLFYVYDYERIKAFIVPVHIDPQHQRDRQAGANRTDVPRLLNLDYAEDNAVSPAREF